MKFFYLQKSDRRTIILLLCVIVAAVVVMKTVDDGSTEEAALTQLETDKQDHRQRQQPRSHAYYQTEERKAELFPFDPNSADSTQLLRLGLQPWQVRNI